MAGIIAVVFMTEPDGAHGRQQASGIVLSSKWVRNTRYVLVASAAWKCERWMSINRVQFR